MVAAVRDKSVGDAIAVGNIGPETEWRSALAMPLDVVIHLAAQSHAMNDGRLGIYRVVNVQGTLNLARQAAALGIRRFVFLSSVKVNGESTSPDCPFHADDTPAPEDIYGISKHEAEQLLRQIATETGMELVIIRPPLVYGPGVKANFGSLMRWLIRGVPLPLASVTSNQRSLVALDNLVDLIITCLQHPSAANETFLVSDGEDISTADLLCRLGDAMGKPARLFPVPPALLRAAAAMVGRGDIMERLLGNLQVDMSHTYQTLRWKPPISVNEGLRRTIQGLGE